MNSERQSTTTTLLHGKYELGRVLGHGSFAKVYHARNLKTGQHVAMKVVGKEKVIKVGMMEQVKREISVMKMVKHPNIVELHEVMASKSKIYISIELVRGGELFNKVSKGRLKEDLASLRNRCRGRWRRWLRRSIWRRRLRIRRR